MTPVAITNSSYRRIRTRTAAAAGTGATIMVTGIAAAAILFIGITTICMAADHVHAEGGSAFNIYVRNAANTPIQFMLFQKVFKATLETFSVAWRVGMLAPQGSEGPYILPEEIEVMVMDVDESDPRAQMVRHTGPYPAEFNDKWNFLLASSDAVPLLTKAPGVAPAGQIMISNDPHSYKAVNMSLSKNGTPLIRQGNVRPGSAEVLSIEPAIYIAYIQPGSMRQGEDFRAVNIGTPHEGFKLKPGQTTVRIEIFAHPNGLIDYRLA